MDDYTLDQRNREALDTYDRAAEQGPHAFDTVCPVCDNDVDQDEDRCSSCGWYRP